jgi:hypothetical protein
VSANKAPIVAAGTVAIAISQASRSVGSVIARRRMLLTAARVSSTISRRK